MTPLQNRRFAVAAVGVLVLALALGLGFGLSGGGHKAGPRAAASPSPAPTHRAPARRVAHPVVCPMTGVRPAHGKVPHRRLLAVKIENLPAARPQSGLNGADVVYEEPVEQGITRFIVLFQCGSAGRLEPIRSGRLVDPDILRQYGHPLMAYAGGIQPVIDKIDHSGIIDINFLVASSAYHRDPARFAPHNLYSSTADLWAVGRPGPPPAQPFLFNALTGWRRHATEVHVPFSGYSDVYWRYDPAHHDYLRFYGSSPAMLSDGSQISATNVIVMKVLVGISVYVEDPLGSREISVKTWGANQATYFRDGRVLVGKWVRPKLSDHFMFEDRSGHPVSLHPGRTWIELLPQTIQISFH